MSKKLIWGCSLYLCTPSCGTQKSKKDHFPGELYEALYLSRLTDSCSYLFICLAVLSISLRWNLKQLCPARREYRTFCPHKGQTIYLLSSFLEECVLFLAIAPFFLSRPFLYIMLIFNLYRIYIFCFNNMSITGGVFKAIDGRIWSFSIKIRAGFISL